MTQEKPKIETNWYTVKVQNNYENKVKERIELEMSRNKSDLKIVIPMERTFSVKKGKKVFKDKPKCNGYMYVETKNIAELINIVRATTGATKVLTNKDKDGREYPVRLRSDEVLRMLNEDAELQKPVSEDLYVPGELVKILDGPFIDFEGTVESVDPENSKLKVAVKIFGRPTPVECTFEIVQKVA